MINLHTLTLMYSWKCNLTCSHCGFSCGPERTEKMSPEEMLDYIETASHNPDLSMVAYSGGEPLLYYQDILQAMELSHRKGLAGGLVTNCFWADSRQTAVKHIQEMADRGLIELIVSLDDFHLKEIPVANIRHAVQAAIGLGVKVGVNMVVTKHSLIRRENVPELLQIAPELFETEKIWAREGGPLLVGRARDYLKKEDLYQYGESELGNSACYYAGNNMVITPDSSLYSCCGFGDASDWGPASITFQGNLHEQSFDNLADRASRNLLLNILADYGPYALLKLVTRYYPEIKYPSLYVSNCDICGEISTNQPLLKALKSVLHKIAGNEVADSEATVSTGKS